MMSQPEAPRLAEALRGDVFNIENSLPGRLEDAFDVTPSWIRWSGHKDPVQRLVKNIVGCHPSAGLCGGLGAETGNIVKVRVAVVRQYQPCPRVNEHAFNGHTARHRFDRTPPGRGKCPRPLESDPEPPTTS